MIYVLYFTIATSFSSILGGSEQSRVSLTVQPFDDCRFVRSSLWCFLMNAVFPSSHRPITSYTTDKQHRCAVPFFSRLPALFPAVETPFAVACETSSSGLSGAMNVQIYTVSSHRESARHPSSVHLTGTAIKANSAEANPKPQAPTEFIYIAYMSFRESVVEG